MKILIVDDSRAMQGIVRRAIMGGTPDDLEIKTANSGPEALELVQAFKPDILLTDWHMPGMTGLQMVQGMRQMGLRDMYVGFVTTETQNIRVQEALGSGANFVLNKPFKDEELQEKLAPIIEKIKSSPAPAAADPKFKPVATERLNKVLLGIFKATHFTLSESELKKEHLSEENMLALYREDVSKALSIVGILTTPCVTLVGGAILGMSPKEIKACLESGVPTDGMKKEAANFMRKVAAVLRSTKPGDISLLKESMVSRNFAKLESMLAGNQGACYFTLMVPGQGSARMGFILV